MPGLSCGVPNRWRGRSHSIIKCLAHDHVFRHTAGQAGSDGLVHLCGRARQDMTLKTEPPQRRLATIVSGGRFLAKVPYGGGLPAVCASEAPLDHLAFLITLKGFCAMGHRLLPGLGVQRRGWPVLAGDS